MIRIASGAGFWGDYPDAPARLLETAEFDYLQLEYLAEVTMGVLSRLSNSGREGYATDFIEMILDEHLETLLDRGVTVVTNAGGVDPETCAREARDLANRRGQSPLIATVSGDDLTDTVPTLREKQRLAHLETGEMLPESINPMAAVAYLGSDPIRAALDRGADIVITGRVADPALTLGPLLHEFNWDGDAYDRLAAGTVAGHLIECGTQVTGGNYLGDWEALSFPDIGYPIAEVTADGTVTITKPAGTGGAVTTGTVTEQLLYEIGDPSAYLTPDVTADFSCVNLATVSDDAVRVTTARGSQPPDTYKMTIHYENGYKLAGQLLYSRPVALKKARRAATILEHRIDDLNLTIKQTRAEYIGHNASHGPLAPEETDYNEIMLRFAARGPSREDLRRLGMEFAPLSVAGPPAVTGLTGGGRPSPQPVIDTWPTTILKTAVSSEVTLYE